MTDCLVMASHLIDTFVKTSRRRQVAEHLGFTKKNVLDSLKCCYIGLIL